MIVHLCQQVERKLEILERDKSMAMELKPDVQMLEKTMAELNNLEEMIQGQPSYLCGAGRHVCIVELSYPKSIQGNARNISDKIYKGAMFDNYKNS